MKQTSPLQDRRSLAAGALILWVALSPWIWGFAGSRPAVANHVSFVLGVGPLALMIVALRPAAIVTIIAGVWLALSPWVLGYAGVDLAWVNELITGLLLVVLSASAAGVPVPIRTGRRRGRPRATPSTAVTLDPAEPPVIAE